MDYERFYDLHTRHSEILREMELELQHDDETTSARGFCREMQNLSDRLLHDVYRKERNFKRRMNYQGGYAQRIAKLLCAVGHPLSSEEITFALQNGPPPLNRLEFNSVKSILERSAMKEAGELIRVTGDHHQAYWPRHLEIPSGWKAMGASP